MVDVQQAERGAGGNVVLPTCYLEEAEATLHVLVAALVADEQAPEIAAARAYPLLATPLRLTLGKAPSGVTLVCALGAGGESDRRCGACQENEPHPAPGPSRNALKMSLRRHARATHTSRARGPSDHESTPVARTGPGRRRRAGSSAVIRVRDVPASRAHARAHGRR